MIFSLHCIYLEVQVGSPRGSRQDIPRLLSSWLVKFRTKLPMWKESVKLPDYRRKRIGPKTDLTVFLAYSVEGSRGM